MAGFLTASRIRLPPKMDSNVSALAIALQPAQVMAQFAILVGRASSRAGSSVASPHPNRATIGARPGLCGGRRHLNVPA
jgi:hypothetical protein